MLLVTPEYNYSVPGVFKNAIDWASRPYGDSAWSGKPAAIMSASGGSLGVRELNIICGQMFVFLNMYTVNQPEVTIPQAQQRFDAQGILTDENSKKLIRQLLEELARLTRLHVSAAIERKTADPRHLRQKYSVIIASCSGPPRPRMSRVPLSTHPSAVRFANIFTWFSLPVAAECSRVRAKRVL